MGKKGVVRDKSTHIEVIDNVIAYALSIGFRVLDLTFSPIKGPEGNIEYLVHLEKCQPQEAAVEEKIDVKTVVSEAFEALRG